MKLNKKVIIFCIVILIVAIIIGIYLYNRFNHTANNTIKENAYIDVWRDNSMDSDIDLYSKGSGTDAKLYLGLQPLHYLINKNGDIYTYQDSSYQNIMTGKKDPATSKYLKTLSQSDVKKIENELKSIAENNNSNSISLYSTYWYIKINGKTTKVDVNVYQYVLEKYLDENYTQTINNRNLVNSIYNFIKENYATNQDALYSGSFDMFSLTDKEKNIILDEYKKENPNIKFADDELLSIIEHQAFMIWCENAN